VSVITGGGEAVALVFRLLFGRLADRADRRWALALWGYGLTMVAVPLLGLTRGVGLAAALMLAERFGKAVRSPAKDSTLAQAGTAIGRGWAFAIHEALDQVGAFIGPLIVAGAIALTGAYGPGFLVLAVPGVAVMAVLVGLRARVPDASVYEDEPVGPWASSDTGGRTSIVGRFTRRLEEAGISGSMGGVGSAFDNAAAESLFATIKRELVNRNRFPTRAAARAAVFEFVEVFYNRRRLHSSLGYLSPAEWERRFHKESQEATVA
jgi:MFS family permease